MEQIGHIFSRYAFWTLIAAVTAAGLYIGLPKYYRSQGLKEKRLRLERQIDETKREIAILKDKQRRFNTDREFVESLARESKRVFPGEIVFIFKD